MHHVVRLRKLLESFSKAIVFSIALATSFTACRPTILGVDEKADAANGKNGTLSNTGQNASSAVSIRLSEPSLTELNSVTTLDVDVTYTGALAITLKAADVLVTADDGNPICSTVDVQGSGLSNRKILVSGCTGEGQIHIDVAAGTAVGINGEAEGTGGTTNAIVVHGNRPTVFISRKTGQLATTSTTPIQFTVTFNIEIDALTFTSSDIVQDGTAEVTDWTVVDSGDHTRFTIKANEVVGNGTIIPAIAAGGVTDVFGNPNLLSTAISLSSRTVTYSETTRYLGFTQDYSAVTEGSGTNVITLPVTLSAAKPYDVNFTYTVNEDFSSGYVAGDFQFSTYSGTIPAGQTSTSISFNYDGDNIQQSEPRFIQVDISSTTNSNAVQLSQSPSFRLMIRDDDGGHDPMVTLDLGINHACGILQSGKLMCWGGNGFSQLGDNTTIPKFKPIEVDSGTLYSAVSCGTESTCGITTAGVLKCWGYNDAGQVGVNSTNNVSSPTAIDGAIRYVSISVGYRQACGITTTGDLRCWGMNDSGSMGVGSGSSYYTVPQAVDFGTTYTHVEVGSSNVSAITSAGELKSWGKNYSSDLVQGMVGDGTSITRSSPVVIDTGTSYAQIARGYVTGCAITVAGVLKCWGANSGNQVGDGTKTTRLSPVIVNSGTSYTSIAMGTSFACGITTAGVLKCWGTSNGGAFGEKVSGKDSSTPMVVDSGVTYSKVSVGGDSVCGITTTGWVKCWGSNEGAVHGGGQAFARSEPFVVDAGVSYSKVSGNDAHACATTERGVLKCWGTSSFAEVGDGTATNNNGPGPGWTRAMPVTVDPGVPYQNVAAGKHHTCAIKSDSKVKCWGHPVPLGTLANSSSGLPIAINSTLMFKKLVGGVHLNCAISADDKLYCWGQNATNQLGLNIATTTVRYTPAAVDATNSYQDVAVGEGYGCAITTGKKLRCWGNNGHGNLGDGTLTSRTTPGDTDSAQNYLKISLSTTTACGILVSGERRCWGNNTAGQFGNGTTVSSSTPATIEPGITYDQIAISTTHGCGIRTGGELVCWGSNDQGQVGDGTFLDRTSPVVVDSGTLYKEIISSQNYSCGVTTSGILKCWGSNRWGQIGDASYAALGGISPVW